MNIEEFEQSTQESEPRTDFSEQLKALWWDANDHWEKAHDIAQDLDSKDGAWIHAYLHRKEGDLSNARYWYHQAGKATYEGPLQEEWRQLASAFLQQ